MRGLQKGITLAVGTSGSVSKVYGGGTGGNMVWHRWKYGGGTGGNMVWHRWKYGGVVTIQ